MDIEAAEFLWVHARLRSPTCDVLDRVCAVLVFKECNRTTWTDAFSDDPQSTAVPDIMATGRSSVSRVYVLSAGTPSVLVENEFPRLSAGSWVNRRGCHLKASQAQQKQCG